MKKENLLKSKPSSFLTCRYNHLLFSSILKTLWILPVVCRAVLYLLYLTFNFIYLNASFNTSLMIVVYDPSYLMLLQCLLNLIRPCCGLIMFATLVGSVHSVGFGHEP